MVMRRPGRFECRRPVPTSNLQERFRFTASNHSRTNLNA